MKNTIPLAHFISNSHQDIDLKDAVNIVFTIASDGEEEVQKSMYISDIEFTKSTLSTSDEVLEENATLLFPNPMKTNSEIRFYSEVNTETDIEIYNTAGILVKKLIVTTTIGNNTFTINRNGLTSGLYFIKISNNFKTYNSKKLILY